MIVAMGERRGKQKRELRRNTVHGSLVEKRPLRLLEIHQVEIKVLQEPLELSGVSISIWRYGIVYFARRRSAPRRLVQLERVIGEIGMILQVLLQLFKEHRTALGLVVDDRLIFVCAPVHPAFVVKDDPFRSHYHSSALPS